MYAASWASPTVSKTKPTAQTATPTHTSAGHSTDPTAAACTGQETNQSATPWMRNTLRTAAANQAERSSVGEWGASSSA